jgi:SNF2 family DNA or RNA helicase
MAHIFNSNGVTTEFDIVVDELNEDDVRAEQPPNTNIVLKLHQLTLLHSCIKMENELIYLKKSKALQDDVSEMDTMKTNIGIIGDRVGSGKSYVILALMLMNDIVEKEDVFVKSTGLNNVIFTLKQAKKAIRTNILVIPHNLTAQWVSYIARYTNALKYMMLNKKTFADITDENVKIEDYDLIIVTSTYYNKFATHVSDNKIKFQRVIYDEVDNLNIPGCRGIDSRFLWMVTASFGNLLYPRGFTRWEPQLHKYIWCANGIANAGFIKNILMDLWGSVPNKCTKLLVLKNTEEFIKKSNVLPDIFKNIVKCLTPITIKILGGIVDRHVLECLNANDIQGAIAHISPSNKGSEENIVDIMIQKYSKIVANLNLKFNYAENYIYDNEDDKEAELKKIKSKINEGNMKINLIKERINESNTCSICYDDMANKTITKCCQNSFCFKCINIWLGKNSVCPMCKTSLKATDIFSVVDEVGEIMTDTNIEEEICDINEKLDKVSNLKILLANRKPGSKFLIFSNYDNSFQDIHITMSSLNIKYMHLKGNSNVIKCMIEKYKTGDVDVLLVNTRHYGSGLNLENTTDIVMCHKFDNEIEKQVIGRAQRLGRTVPLNIWYFLYDNEISLISDGGI